MPFAHCLSTNSSKNCPETNQIQRGNSIHHMLEGRNEDLFWGVTNLILLKQLSQNCAPPASKQQETRIKIKKISQWFRILWVKSEFRSLYLFYLIILTSWATKAILLTTKLALRAMTVMNYSVVLERGLKTSGPDLGWYWDTCLSLKVL